MMRVYVNKVFSVILAILITHSCFGTVSFASDAEDGKIILASFGNGESGSLTKPVSFVGLNTETTFDSASTSLEWTLNSNNFNVNINGKALNTYENGGTLCVRFMGSEGTNFNIVYQKLPNATGAVGNYKQKVTSDGRWQVFETDFSEVAGFYDDATFAVKFDCGGWGLAAGTDYTVNDKIYIDSVWFEPALPEPGEGDEELPPEEDSAGRENEPGLMYISDFNTPDADSCIIGGSGSVSSEKVYGDGTYSLKWVLDKYIDIDLPSDIDWTLYDNVHIRLCSELPGQSLNVVFIAHEKYTSGQIYRLYPQTSGEWEEITVPLPDIEKLFSYSSNEKSMGVLRLDASGWNNTSYTKGSALYLDCIYLTDDEYGTDLNEPASNIDGYSVINPDIGGDNTFKFIFDRELYDGLDDSCLNVLKDGEAMNKEEYVISADLHYFNIAFNERLKTDSSYKVILSGGMVYSAGGAVLKNDVVREFTVGYEHGYAFFDKAELVPGEELRVSIEAIADVLATFAFYNSESNVIECEEIAFETADTFKKTYTVPDNAVCAKVYITDKNGILVYVTYLDGTGKKNAVANSDAGDITSFEVSDKNYGMLDITSEVSAEKLPVMIIIYSPDGNVCHSDAVISADNGAVVYQYIYADGCKSGKYTVSLSSGEIRKSLDVFYISAGDSQTMLNLANDGDDEKLADWLLGNRGIIADIFDSEEKIKDAAGVISENDPYSDFDELYAFMKKIPLCLEVLNGKIWSDMAEYIHEENDLFLYGVDEYSDFKRLSVSKQNDICVKIAGDKPFDTVSEFRKVFADKVNEYIAKSQKNSGGSSGGGGGKKTSSPITAVSVVTESGSNKDNQPEVIISGFDDLEGYEWAENEIKLLFDKGVISTSPDKRYRPGDDITREEFVKLIIQTFFADTRAPEHSFTDEASGAWYNGCLSRAYYLGIVTGKADGSFGIGEKITREDMVTIMSRALEKKGYRLDYDGDALFADSDEISEYAFGYVCAMVKLGIINGMGNGNFAPKANANRAQAAKVVASVLNLYEGGR